MKKFTKALAIAAATLAVSTGAMAADYPAKSVSYVVPFGPGGESDITARLQQKYFQDQYGETMVVTNKPGGGGAVAWAQLNKLKNDGYTIMGMNLPHIILKPRQKDVGFETEAIDSVYIFQHTPDALAVSKDSPFKTLQDLIDFAKKNPGEVTLSGSGKGSANHLLQVMLNKEAGIKTTYVAMKGTAAAINSAVAGHVTASATYSTMGAKNEDSIRLLAIGTDERVARFPDVPTFKELGYNISGGGAFRGVAVPQGTPDDVRMKISEIMNTLNTNPEFVQKMESLGFTLLNVPATETKQFIKDKTDHFVSQAKIAGIIK
ncbi:MAG: tripartite tricarboxylate transporter substrate binding protein [Neptuniibacter sp.]|jgi:tripartite-type tricarboxylate transporter receptor subunit TctC